MMSPSEVRGARLLMPLALPPPSCSAFFSLPVLLAASQLEDLFKLVDREALQIHALLFVARIIEDHQVRVMVRDPLHIRVLPILPPLLLLEIPAHLCIRRLVEPSGGAALEAKLGAGFEILGIGLHDEAVSRLRAAIFERDGHGAIT